MNAHILDLWPDDFDTMENTPPITILREQAAALSKKTRDLITGQIETVVIEPYHSSEEALDILLEDRTPAMSSHTHKVMAECILFRHDFDLSVEALADYRYTLFSVTHDANLYPASIITGIGHTRLCPTEQAFEEGLRQLFAQEATKRVMQALMAQGKASQPEA